MNKLKTDVVVLGAGPGGYAAAFYAADMGKSVILVDKNDNLGGVCLNWGCIPSKALIHATEVMNEAMHAKDWGIAFNKPKVDLKKLRTWKEGVIQKLGGGIAGLAKKRKVEVIQGRGYFEDGETLRVETKDGQKFITFENAIIAAGSRPSIPGAFDLGNKRIMTSKEALEIEDIPKSLLVVGGGIIGMELGSVYANLGSAVTVTEAMDNVLAGADPDLARPVVNRLKKTMKEIRVKAKVKKMATKGKKIYVETETSDGKLHKEEYDKVLVSTGRTPNTENIGIPNTAMKKDERGYIKVKETLQTDEPKIYAIGDIVGGIQLAHKAAKEAKIAVNNIIGNGDSNKNLVIPSVVFTDPEIAWTGLTETEAKAQGIKVKVAKFPWAACGRALTYDRTEGMTKIIADPETDRVLGMGIVGRGAGELISEGTLAIEMGATVEDIAETVHPHPTVSETVFEAAEVYYGHSAHAK